MKFYALILAVLMVVTSVEANEIQESNELVSAKCKAVSRKFVKGWYKMDTNRDGKLTWIEMYSFYVKWAAKHGKSKAWTRKHATKVYRHWAKWAGSKNYVSWKQVWNRVSKRHHC